MKPMRFEIEGQEEKVIRWELNINGLGNLCLFANGSLVAFVGAEARELYLLEDLPEDLGLALDDAGRIKVADG